MPSNKGVIEALMSEAFDAHSNLVAEIYNLQERLSPVMAERINPPEPANPEEPKNPEFVLRASIKKLIRYQEEAHKVVMDMLARLEL